MAFHLNGDTAIPTGDEYTLWVEALDQTQDEWADVDFDWDQLKMISLTTLLMSGTSVALPKDYVKLDGFPMVNGTEYSEIRPEEINLHAEDRYVVPNLNGKYLTVYPAAAADVAVSIPYVGRPTSFTTLTSVSLCPSDNYLIFGGVAKVFLQRDNQKYGEFQAKADLALSSMINKQAVKLDQFDSTIKNKVTQGGFRLGVD